jgi:CheY-like chemotaxis protein
MTPATPRPVLKILVAEDNAPDVTLVRMALDGRGLQYELYHVKDGERAIDFVRRAGSGRAVPVPDLILLDIDLPRNEGDEVLREIRQSPICGSTPVIVITSSDSPADSAKAVALGATRYFSKPSDLDAFLKLGAIVEEVLGLAKA